jgi:hypothetical protein
MLLLPLLREVNIGRGGGNMLAIVNRCWCQMIFSWASDDVLFWLDDVFSSQMMTLLLRRCLLGEMISHWASDDSRNNSQKSGTGFKHRNT